MIFMRFWSEIICLLNFTLVPNTAWKQKKWNVKPVAIMVVTRHLAYNVHDSWSQLYDI